MQKARQMSGRGKMKVSPARPRSLEMRALSVAGSRPTPTDESELGHANPLTASRSRATAAAQRAAGADAAGHVVDWSGSSRGAKSPRKVTVVAGCIRSGPRHAPRSRACKVASAVAAVAIAAVATWVVISAAGAGDGDDNPSDTPVLSECEATLDDCSGHGTCVSSASPPSATHGGGGGSTANPIGASESLACACNATWGGERCQFGAVPFSVYLRRRGNATIPDSDAWTPTRAPTARAVASSLAAALGVDTPLLEGVGVEDLGTDWPLAADVGGTSGLRVRRLRSRAHAAAAARKAYRYRYPASAAAVETGGRPRTEANPTSATGGRSLDGGEWHIWRVDLKAVDWTDEAGDAASGTSPAEAGHAIVLSALVAMATDDAEALLALGIVRVSVPDGEAEGDGVVNYELNNDAPPVADNSTAPAGNSSHPDQDPEPPIVTPPVPVYPLSRVEWTSPGDGEGGVTVTREAVIKVTQPVQSNVSHLVAARAVTANALEHELAFHLLLSRDRRIVTLFWDELLPFNTDVTVRLDGDAFVGAGGVANDTLDGDGDGTPGGVLEFTFRTLDLSIVPNTTLCGRVFASHLNEMGNASVNVPLENVTITIDGDPSPGVTTNEFGNFQLRGTPAGRFFVHIDGRSASALGAAPPGSYYPFVGKSWTSVPGQITNIGEVYLPLVREGTLQSVSDTSFTTIHFAPAVLEEFPGFVNVSIVVPPQALVGPNGPVLGRVGISPVPPDRLPGTLPSFINTALVITVQTDGASNFAEPVPICFPNLGTDAVPALEAGDSSALLSFNHDTGRFEVVGPMTVSDDAQLVCTDPGYGVLAPGWHLPNPGTSVNVRPPLGPALGDDAPEGQDDASSGDDTCPDGRPSTAAKGGFALDAASEALDCLVAIGSGSGKPKLERAAKCTGAVKALIIGLNTGFVPAARAFKADVEAILEQPGRPSFSDFGTASAQALAEQTAADVERTAEAAKECLSPGDGSDGLLKAFGTVTTMTLGRAAAVTGCVASVGRIAEAACTTFYSTCATDQIYADDVCGAVSASREALDEYAGIFSDLASGNLEGFVSRTLSLGQQLRRDTGTILSYFSGSRRMRRLDASIAQNSTLDAALLRLNSTIANVTSVLESVFSDNATMNAFAAAARGEATGEAAFAAVQDAAEIAEGVLVAASTFAPAGFEPSPGHFFAITTDDEGPVVRGYVGAGESIPPLILPPATRYTIASFYWGAYRAFVAWALGTTADNGQATRIESGYFWPLTANQTARGDSDGDQLTDTVEWIIGTNASNPDTDGDGLSDGQEIISGTNPRDGSPAASGIVDSASLRASPADLCASRDVVVTASALGLTVFNVFNRMSPLILGEYPVDGGVDSVSCAQGSPFVVAAIPSDTGNLILLRQPSDEDRASGLGALDVVGPIDVGGTASSAVLVGETAFVGLTDGSLSVVDTLTGLATFSSVWRVPGGVERMTAAFGVLVIVSSARTFDGHRAEPCELYASALPADADFVAVGEASHLQLPVCTGLAADDRVRVTADASFAVVSGGDFNTVIQIRGPLAGYDAPLALSTASSYSRNGRDFIDAALVGGDRGNLVGLSGSGVWTRHLADSSAALLRGEVDTMTWDNFDTLWPAGSPVAIAASSGLAYAVNDSPDSLLVANLLFDPRPTAIQLDVDARNVYAGDRLHIATSLFGSGEALREVEYRVRGASVEGNTDSTPTGGSVTVQRVQHPFDLTLRVPRMPASSDPVGLTATATTVSGETATATWQSDVTLWGPGDGIVGGTIPSSGGSYVDEVGLTLRSALDAREFAVDDVHTFAPFTVHGCDNGTVSIAPDGAVVGDCSTAEVLVADAHVEYVGLLGLLRWVYDAPEGADNRLPELDTGYYRARVDLVNQTGTTVQVRTWVFLHGTATWSGEGDGVSWNNAANWRSREVPTATSTVIVSTASAVNGTTEIVASAGLAARYLASDVHITAGGEVDLRFAELNGLTLNDAAVTVRPGGSVQVGNLHVTGSESTVTVSAGAELRTAAVETSTALIVAGPGQLLSLGFAAFGDRVDMVDMATWTLFGGANLTENWSLAGGATLANAAGSTLGISPATNSNGRLTISDQTDPGVNEGGYSLVNNGTIRVYEPEGLVTSPTEFFVGPASLLQVHPDAAIELGASGKLSLELRQSLSYSLNAVGTYATRRAIKYDGLRAGTIAGGPSSTVEFFLGATQLPRGPNGFVRTQRLGGEGAPSIDSFLGTVAVVHGVVVLNTSSVGGIELWASGASAWKYPTVALGSEVRSVRSIAASGVAQVTLETGEELSIESLSLYSGATIDFHASQVSIAELTLQVASLNGIDGVVDVGSMSITDEIDPRDPQHGPNSYTRLLFAGSGMLRTSGFVVMERPLMLRGGVTWLLEGGANIAGRWSSCWDDDVVPSNQHESLLGLAFYDGSTLVNAAGSTVSIIPGSGGDCSVFSIGDMTPAGTAEGGRTMVNNGTLRLVSDGGAAGNVRVLVQHAGVTHVGPSAILDLGATGMWLVSGATGSSGPYRVPLLSGSGIRGGVLGGIDSVIAWSVPRCCWVWHGLAGDLVLSNLTSFAGTVRIFDGRALINAATVPTVVVGWASTVVFGPTTTSVSSLVLRHGFASFHGATFDVDARRERDWDFGGSLGTPLNSSLDAESLMPAAAVHIESVQCLSCIIAGIDGHVSVGRYTHLQESWYSLSRNEEDTESLIIGSGMMTVHDHTVPPATLVGRLGVVGGVKLELTGQANFSCYSAKYRNTNHLLGPLRIAGGSSVKVAEGAEVLFLRGQPVEDQEGLSWFFLDNGGFVTQPCVILGEPETVGAVEAAGATVTNGGTIRLVDSWNGTGIVLELRRASLNQSHSAATIDLRNNTQLFVNCAEDGSGVCDARPALGGGRVVGGTGASLRWHSGVDGAHPSLGQQSLTLTDGAGDGTVDGLAFAGVLQVDHGAVVSNTASAGRVVVAGLPDAGSEGLVVFGAATETVDSLTVARGQAAVETTASVTFVNLELSGLLAVGKDATATVVSCFVVSRNVTGTGASENSTLSGPGALVTTPSCTSTVRDVLRVSGGARATFEAGVNFTSAQPADMLQLVDPVSGVQVGTDVAAAELRFTGSGCRVIGAGSLITYGDTVVALDNATHAVEFVLYELHSWDNSGAVVEKRGDFSCSYSCSNATACVGYCGAETCGC